MVAFPSERTALVTGVGSARGIGRAVAQRLAEAGWHLALLDVDAAAVGAVALEFATRFAVRTESAAADVSDPVAVVDAIDLLEARLPQLVAVVNIAGVSSAVPYLEVSPQEWRRVMSINLDGVHHVTQRAVRSMVDHGVGRVVSLTSVSAQRGGGTYSKTAYSAAKAGVIGLTRSLARELGHHGITANAIAPGPVDTDIMGGTLSEERKQAMAADGVLPRIGVPADVAAAVEYLVSEDASYVTGQTLNVNGGLYMQ